MRYRLPIPSSWQDFEALCHQLWKEIWADPNAQRNGRAGQPQHGVDIFGRPMYRANDAGVQCKDKDSRLGCELKESELIKECGKASHFSPALDTFTVATTAPRDGDLQGRVRTLRADQSLPFDVHVWSWEDIEAEVLCRPTLLSAFYGGILTDTDELTVKIAASAPRDQFNAFFTRPQLLEQLGPGIRNESIQLAYELCDNAFNHGRARQVRLSFEGSRLQIEDDGGAFDPTIELNQTAMPGGANLGAFVLASFLSRFAEDVSLTYFRVGEGTSARNRVSIDYRNLRAYDRAPEILDLPVNTTTTFSRDGARRLAAAFPISPGIEEVVLTLVGPLYLSLVAQFLREVRLRLPSEVRLTVSYARDGLPPHFLEHFEKSGVRFLSR